MFCLCVRKYGYFFFVFNTLPLIGNILSAFHKITTINFLLLHTLLLRDHFSMYVDSWLPDPLMQYCLSYSVRINGIPLNRRCRVFVGTFIREAIVTWQYYKFHEREHRKKAHLCYSTPDKGIEFYLQWNECEFS